MRLVVDSNGIIAALIKEGFTRRIITHSNVELLSIYFSKDEVGKYKEIILKKSGLNEIGFEMILAKLNESLIYINEELVKSKMKEAKKIMDKIDKDDTPFIAAALATQSDIWSDDKHFEKQNVIKVWKTKDLIPLL